MRVRDFYRRPLVVRRSVTYIGGGQEAEWGFQVSDLSEHPFAVFMAGESYESPSERAWLKWVKKVEKLSGLKSLDGLQDSDGYSIDYAYEVWANGESAESYAAEIKSNEIALEAAFGPSIR